ncbi:hypothetical protein [Nocardiopsis halophila]|uniref:hypothetical protein n=1 Tax=Nocardiopsis halophila TaxID=141692 RepID=UPI0003480215|nr:hypothetical protein [Nocardiopsis halophila]
MNSPIATATDRETALLAAAAITNPAHPAKVATAAVHGRIACHAWCSCGWEAIRPTRDEAELEAVLHRLDPDEWLETGRSDYLAAGGDEFWEIGPADLPAWTRTEAA